MQPHETENQTVAAAEGRSCLTLLSQESRSTCIPFVKQLAQALSELAACGPRPSRPDAREATHACSPDDLALSEIPQQNLR